MKLVRFKWSNMSMYPACVCSEIEWYTYAENPYLIKCWYECLSSNECPSQLLEYIKLEINKNCVWTITAKNIPPVVCIKYIIILYVAIFCVLFNYTKKKNTQNTKHFQPSNELDKRNRSRRRRRKKYLMLLSYAPT